MILSLLACAPGPLAFDGVQSVAWDRADGLEVRWEAAGGAPALYRVRVGDDVSVELSPEQGDGGALSVTGLADGDYAVSVTAGDAGGAEAGGEQELWQRVGAERVELRGEVELEEATGLASDGRVAWVAGGGGEIGIRVVDIADPGAPVVLGEVRDAGQVLSLAVADGLLVTAQDRGAALSGEWDGIGSRVYTVEADGLLTYAGPLDPEVSSVHDVAVAGGHAFIVDNDAGSLGIYALDDPSAPVRVATWTGPDGVHNVTVADGLAYVTWWTGFSVLDVSDPANPVELVTQLTGAEGMHSITPLCDGAHVLTGDETPGGHLRVWKLEGGGATEIASWITDADHIVHRIAARAEVVHVAWYVDGLVVLDLSDPAAPEWLGGYDSYDESQYPEPPPDSLPGTGLVDGAWAVTPWDGGVAFTDRRRGLLLADVWPFVVRNDEGGAAD